MKKIILLFILTLLVHLGYSQEFEFKLFAESGGQKDSVVIGFDRSATTAVDSSFGEVNISSTRFDTIFEIRAGQVDYSELACSGIQDLTRYPDLIRYVSVRDFFPLDCSGWKPPSGESVFFSTLFFKNDDLPITLRWDQDLFQSACTASSIITSWHPDALYHVTCTPEIPEVVSFNGIDSLVIDRPAWNQVVDQFGDTLSLMFILLGPEETIISTKDLDSGKLQVFPNPVNNFLTLSFDEVSRDKSNVMIYDLNGRLVHNVNVPNDVLSFNIDVTNWSSGVYHLIVQRDQNVLYSKKILVQN